MAITEKNRKILWGRSGNRCAICRTELVLEKDPYNKHLNIGEECHIISRQPNGPRHVAISDFDYDSSVNLLLLCCNHHTIIDEKVETYPEDQLRKIKEEHESWVKENLETTNGNSITVAQSKGDLVNSTKNKQKKKEHSKKGFSKKDKEKSKELIEKLNVAISQEFLKNHPQSVGFKYNNIKPIDEFINTYSSVLYKFKDETLSNIFDKLYSELEKYRNKVGIYMVSNNDFYSIPVSIKNSKPEQFYKEADELDELATLAYNELEKAILFLIEKDVL